MLSANAENDDLVVAQAERIEELEDEVGDQPSPIGPRLFTGSIPDDQFAPGEAATVDEWDMTIEEWIPDATEEILDHDTSNDAPDAGTVLTLVTISGTYEGTGSSLPWLDIGVGYVGSDQLRRTDTSCRAATPDAMAEIRLVSNGDSITGTFCIALPADQIGTGSAYLHETTSPAEPIWFQVD